jgi:uncharacterized protein (TIGR02246 family)
MSRRRNLFTAVVLLTLIFAGVPAAGNAQTPSSANADEAAIRQIVKQLEDGWNAHDGKAFAAPFATDADYVVVSGMFVKGREAIEQGHIGIFTTIYKDSRNVATIKSVRFLRPDIAVAHVEWNLEFKMNGEARKGHAMNTLILAKEGGKWSIAAFQNTPIEPQTRH